MKIISLEETQNLSNIVSKSIKQGDIIFLHGEIGTGKTTFARFLINSMEIQNNLKYITTTACARRLFPHFSFVLSKSNNYLLKN